MKAFLKKLTGKTKPKRNSDDQKAQEAIIELILSVQFVDNKILLSEQEFLEEYLQKLHWDSGIVIERFMDAAIHRVRDVSHNPGKLKRHIHRLRKHLKSPSHKREALSLLTQMANADGNVSPEEGIIMRWLRESLSHS